MDMQSVQLYARLAGETALNAVIFLVLWLKGLCLVFVPSSWRFKEIQDQVALVTGAGSGLGRGLCRRLADRGATVIAVDVNEKGVQETVRLIREAGGQAYEYVCDISNRQRVLEMASQVLEQVGPVDLLFNNAGVVSGHRFQDISEEDVMRTFGVNTFANFWVSRWHLGFHFEVSYLIGNFHAFSPSRLPPRYRHAKLFFRPCASAITATLWPSHRWPASPDAFNWSTIALPNSLPSVLRKVFEWKSLRKDWATSSLPACVHSSSTPACLKARTRGENKFCFWFLTFN